ncbi:hypothetical protein [Novosphingobium album (ex Hu et al. 2023)]|uniref:EF-hand domain-containing protein n=1 Tax=Novosphingobium album (ex Hu et al. 2023) TaxID=2930093 RepID=A0ABT0AY67_9SPHN|nr:hypothetical protein [Novosphingobium album (ex Hu et al. 2023)]MCJ2177761.1 hypothetical protein [Novosphingobium album (ex Hu et al. 2023)]
MNRFLLGGLAALIMAGVGLFWWQGRAEVEKAAPPPEVAPSFDPEDLPSAELGDANGPEPPEATDLTREQRRFGRYDRNSDGRISRNEMLSTRTAAFRKLDKDGNNLLSFEEWAVTTVDKFDRADVNRDDQLTPAEFARTAPPPKPKSRCSC